VRRERFALEPYGLKLLLMGERLAASLRHLDAIADMPPRVPAFAPRPPAYAERTSSSPTYASFKTVCGRTGPAV
jgi:hypothetical protein